MQLGRYVDYAGQFVGDLRHGGGARPYDANNLAAEFCDSGQNSADAPGCGIKFSSPMAANGKVHIAAGHDLVSVADLQGELDGYGLKR